MKIKNLELDVKPYTTKEMAAIYQVSPKTFNRWVTRIRTDVGEKNGRFFTINQVKTILDKIGLPGTIE
jgi:hypothetical protein